jgi:hypothetical protein
VTRIEPHHGTSIIADTPADVQEIPAAAVDFPGICLQVIATCIIIARVGSWIG